MGALCGCGQVCNHGLAAYDHLGNTVPGPSRGLPGFGQGIVLDRSVNPWDFSQWTIIEWGAAAGILASLMWAWSIYHGKGR